ncbi:hypothetical protein L1887_52865 [Cichorium endivia]|nr:hypothetical protein L1887_52865 [Cichorium endivia]
MSRSASSSSPWAPTSTSTPQLPSSRALKVYPQPVELIMIYQKAVPKEVFDTIMRIVSKEIATGGAAEGMSAENLDEVDDDGPSQLEASKDEDDEDDDEEPEAKVDAAATEDKDASAGAASATPAAASAPRQGTDSGTTSSQEWDTLSATSLNETGVMVTPNAPASAASESPDTKEAAPTPSADELKPPSIDTSASVTQSSTQQPTTPSKQNFTSGWSPAPVFGASSPRAEKKASTLSPPPQKKPSPYRLSCPSASAARDVGAKSEQHQQWQLLPCSLASASLRFDAHLSLPSAVPWPLPLRCIAAYAASEAVSSVDPSPRLQPTKPATASKLYGCKCAFSPENARSGGQVGLRHVAYVSQASSPRRALEFMGFYRRKQFLLNREIVDCRSSRLYPMDGSSLCCQLPQCTAALHPHRLSTDPGREERGLIHAPIRKSAASGRCPSRHRFLPVSLCALLWPPCELLPVAVRLSPARFAAPRNPAPTPPAFFFLLIRHVSAYTRPPAPNQLSTRTQHCDFSLCRSIPRSTPFSPLSPPSPFRFIPPLRISYTAMFSRGIRAAAPATRLLNQPLRSAAPGVAVSTAMRTGNVSEVRNACIAS